MRRARDRGERERYHFSILWGSWARGLLLFPIALSAVAASPARCQRPGGVRPVTYKDVRRHARQVAAVTKRRFMPPWLPEPGHGEFTEDRRLTNAQIQLIQVPKALWRVRPRTRRRRRNFQANDSAERRT